MSLANKQNGDVRKIELLRQGLCGHGPLANAVEIVSAIFVVLSAILIALDSMQNMHDKYGQLLISLEVILSFFFLLEYLARLWAAENRWRYALSFWGIVDLLSTIPLLLVFGEFANPAKTLRLVKMARLLRILRIGSAHQRLLDAFIQVRGEIIAFTLLSLWGVFFAAVGIYYFEHNAQPEVFSSIPESMWWAIVTLTTVGYGDAYPITTGGRIFTGVILFIGLALLAVPTGLLSTALLADKNLIDEDLES